MTADEVLEAMGEAITAEAGHMGIALPGRVTRTLARAAIRALPAGWVVAKVPEPKRGDDDLSAYQQGVEVGWNNCAAAVRASAVKVG